MMKAKLLILIFTVSISVAFLFDLNAMADQTPPGISISKVVDRGPALIPGLKSQYKVCADQRALYQRLFKQGGFGWTAVKETLPQGYNVSEVTAPEPDWKKQKVGVQYEKEYLYDDKYALYRVAFRYEISDVGRCELIKHEDLEIEIDNGDVRYQVTLRDKKPVQSITNPDSAPLKEQYGSYKVEQMSGRKKVRQEAQLALDEVGKDEKIAKLIALLLSDQKSNKVTAVDASFNTKIADQIKAGMGYAEDNFTKTSIPKSNDEHIVAGQACDIISAKKMSTRIWYWDNMHYYPGVVERPIILKQEQKDRTDAVVALIEATDFHLLSKVDDALFELPSGLR